MFKLVSSVRLPGERRYLRTTERNQPGVIVLSLGSLRGPLPPPPCAVGRGSPPGFEPGPPSPFSASIQVDVGVQSESGGLAGRALPFLRNLVITAKLGSGSQLAATGSFVFISSLKNTFKKQQQHNHIAVLKNLSRFLWTPFTRSGYPVLSRTYSSAVIPGHVWVCRPVLRIRCWALFSLVVFSSWHLSLWSFLRMCPSWMSHLLGIWAFSSFPQRE